jgi:hypothetical protein
LRTELAAMEMEMEMEEDEEEEARLTLVGRVLNGRKRGEQELARTGRIRLTRLLLLPFPSLLLLLSTRKGRRRSTGARPGATEV